jgi:hypothetical protein
MKLIIIAATLIFLTSEANAQYCGVPLNQTSNYANAGAETQSMMMENYYRCLERSRNQQNLEALQRQQQQNQNQMQQPIQIQPPPIFERRH